MAIKFSDLSNTAQLSPSDVFAVTDVDQNSSVSITFSDLKNIMVDANTFVDHANNITTALNNNTSAGSIALDADTFGGQSPSYYLNYNNLDNTTVPDIPTDLHDLTNSFANGGFVKFKADGENSKLIFDRVETDQTGNNVLLASQDMTTDYVLEGQNNKYYTDGRVDDFFEDNFARYFNTYAATFDQGEVNDSYFDTVGYAPQITAGMTDIIRVKTEGIIPGRTADDTKRNQAGRFSAYKRHKALRIYGADSVVNSTIQNQVTITTPSANAAVGFTQIPDVSAGSTTITFPAVNFDVANNAIAIDTHGFPSDGSNPQVIYDSTDGDTPGSELISGTIFKVQYVNANKIKLLYTSNSQVVPLSSGSTGTSHKITSVNLAPANPFQRFTYTVAEWDLQTGKVASSVEKVAVNISVPGSTAPADEQTFLVDDINAIKNAFNVENFVKLDFSYDNGLGDSGPGVTPGRGLCIYRSVGQVNTIDEQLQGITKLVAVLGPNELKSNSWIDYFTDDVLSYNGKEQEDNSYIPENTVHFKPLIAPTTPQKGWVDAEVDSVAYQDPESISTSTYIDIKLKQPIAMSGSEQDGVWIAHNDTTGIQSAITANSSRGQKAIQLNPKQYVVSSLTIPDNFSISGFAYSTKFTKLPWSGWGGSSSISSATVLKTSSGSMQDVSFVGFDIDGNSINSVGFDDSSTLSKNYAIDCGQNSKSVLLDKIRLSSPIGGGIYSPDPKDLTISGCVVTDAQISDRFVYSPLVADGGENTMLSSNRFENFPNGSVNVSVTNKGVVEGNIISNCGTGLEVFASKFMITSPNVLTGPAGELLPQPDAYNSEYDQINIDLTSNMAALPVTSFDSGPMRYQENGEDYDLLNNPVNYKLFAIQKDAQGDESIWIDNLMPKLPNDDGVFEDVITITVDATNSSNIDTTNNTITMTDHGLTTGDPLTYDENGGSWSDLTTGGVLHARVIDEDTVQLYPTVSAALDLAVETSITNITAVASSGTAHTFTRNVYLTINETEQADNIKQNGGFQFNISAESVKRMKLQGQMYTLSNMRDSGQNIAGLDANNNPTLVSGNPLHIGVGWSATVEQYVVNGIIENGPAGSDNPATWSAQYTDGANTYADYTVLLKDYKYLTPGRKIRPTVSGPTDHANFSAGSPALTPAPATYGVIKSVSEAGTNRVVVIQWENANKVDPATAEGSAVPGSGGTMEALNSFVIATGRIK